LSQSAGILVLSDIKEMHGAEGCSIFYTDTGSGMPLLFVHGWLMSQRVWALQAHLQTRFRVITLDLRGHGSAGEADFSYNSCCEDISLLLSRLGLYRVTLIGWSMGAQIAIKAYHSLQEKVAGMVLVGGTPHFCSSSDFSCGVAPAEARSMALRIKRDYSRTAGEFFSNMFSKEESAAIDMKLLVAKVVSKLPSRDTALSALNELISSDLRAYLPLISAPVLLIHGVDDKICLPCASQFMAEKIPSATIELLPSVGHAPFLSNPAAFNGMLSAFAQAVHG